MNYLSWSSLCVILYVQYSTYVSCFIQVISPDSYSSLCNTHLLQEAFHDLSYPHSEPTEKPLFDPNAFAPELPHVFIYYLPIKPFQGRNCLQLLEKWFFVCLFFVNFQYIQFKGLKYHEPYLYKVKLDNEHYPAQLAGEVRPMVVKQKVKNAESRVRMKVAGREESSTSPRCHSQGGLLEETPLELGQEIWEERHSWQKRKCAYRHGGGV